MTAIRKLLGVTGLFSEITATDGIYTRQTSTSSPRMIPGGTMRVMIRHDDNCRNGHETFTITASILGEQGFEAGGCLHGEVRKFFPEFTPLIKWHLCSTSGPMHCVANMVYHAAAVDFDGETTKVPSLHFARGCAVWPEATDEELLADEVVLTAALLARLPGLLKDFESAVVSCGFEYRAGVGA